MYILSNGTVPGLVADAVLNVDKVFCIVFNLAVNYVCDDVMMCVNLCHFFLRMLLTPSED
jgi:hypothetical protein